MDLTDSSSSTFSVLSENNLRAADQSDPRSFPSVSQADGRTRSGVNRTRSRQLAPWLAGTVSLLLVFTTLMIGWRVRESMRRVNRVSIETIRNANVAVMELWLSGCSDDINVAAADDTIQAACRSLIKQHLSSSPTDQQETLGDQQETLGDQGVSFRQQLQALQYDRREYKGWCLIDSQGAVVASSQPNLIDQRIPIGEKSQERLDRLLTTVTHPFSLSSSTNVQKGKTPVLSPMMLVISPIRDGVGSIGGLALIIDPLDRFCNLFRTAQIGRSCETIAVNQAGVLITRSRFESQLRRSGLLNRDEDVSSVLHVHARVPPNGQSVVGWDDARLQTLPLTVAADQATRGATGANMSGYRDYRGVEVIGTWCWVPKFNFGVVTKIDYEEAYGPMQILRNSFLLLLSVAMLASLGLFALVGVIRRFSAESSPLRRLGQYELTQSIGFGGMADVYKGRHESLRRDVAVKVLEPVAVNHHSFARFEREVRLTAKLRHPNTIDIYDYGRTEEGAFFYVMEYVKGVSVEELIRDHGRQSPGRVIHVMNQICGSLQEAHLQGMVHRDIKPANVLVSSQAGVYDLVKVLDFGLVKEVDHDTLQLTQVASITGTPLYMSPEAVRDASTADARSDIYSVGALGYHLLCAKPIFTGEHAADICAKQLNETPLRPSARLAETLAETLPSELPDELPVELPDELPSDLEDILMACLEKEPAKRPGSMAELSEALQKCVDARHWGMVDAQAWWERTKKQSVESPRDVGTDFADNAHCGSEFEK